jgi:hypothetical protein
MAMRDPGRPGRNPFFDHSPDAELGEPIGGPEPQLADPYADPIGADASAADGAGAGPAGDAFTWPGGSTADPLGFLAALIDGLQDAQPEATEHLVVAAHELVLAVKTIVDATEAVLAAQRAAARPAGGADADEDEQYDPFASDRFDEPAPERPGSNPTPPSGVRRIDLA